MNPIFFYFPYRAGHQENWLIKDGQPVAYNIDGFGPFLDNIYFIGESGLACSFKDQNDKFRLLNSPQKVSMAASAQSKAGVIRQANTISPSNGDCYYYYYIEEFAFLHITGSSIGRKSANRKHVYNEFVSLKLGSFDWLVKYEEEIKPLEPTKLVACSDERIDEIINSSKVTSKPPPLDLKGTSKAELLAYAEQLTQYQQQALQATGGSLSSVNFNTTVPGITRNPQQPQYKYNVSAATPPWMIPEIYGEWIVISSNNPAWGDLISAETGYPCTFSTAKNAWVNNTGARAHLNKNGNRIVFG